MENNPPIGRAVYTQISYLFFIDFVSTALRHFCSVPAPTPKRSFLLGLFAGMLTYIYFFAWLSAFVIGLGLIIGRPWLIPERLSAYEHIRRSTFGIFFLGFFVASFPALVIMVARQTQGVVPGNELREYWFFPVERLLASGIALFLATRTSLLRYRSILFFAAIVGFLEFPLMNLQPLLGQGMAPYHFPLFYLLPLWSGAVLTSGFVVFDQVWRLPKNSNIAKTTLLCLLLVLDLRQSLQPGVSEEFMREAGSLVRFVEDQTSQESVIAVSSLRNPFRMTPFKGYLDFPTTFGTLANRFILHQEWMFAPLNSDQDLRREIGMGWLLSGRPQLLIPCQSEVELPGDIFFLTRQYYELRRKRKCEMFKYLINTYSPCKFLSEFKTDYLLLYPGMVIPDQLGGLLRLVYTTKEGTFRLYSFDQNRAKSYFCATERTRVNSS